MASDTYYKDMWLRRNRTAVQVVIVLLSVIALMMLIQFMNRGSRDRLQSPHKSPGGETAQKMVDPGGHVPNIRGRVFGDEDDFDPDMEDLAEEPHVQVNDCCTIYDLWQPSHDDMECSPLNAMDAELPPALVCYYDDDDPRSEYNTVDGATAKLINKQLTRGGPTYGFIDVGAELGAYSFVAASLETSVLATEPNIDHVARYHKGSKLGRHERWITLLNDKVAESRGLVTVVEGKPQVKQILLDDLPAFCKFRKAAMRINLKGLEHRAFQHAKSLFKEIQITFVYFTWANLKHLTDTEDLELMEDMIKYFNKRGYVPRGYDGKVLSIKKWNQWPDKIYWQKM